MRITATEPQFSLASARFGEEIRRQFVTASRRSRPFWRTLFEAHRAVIPSLRDTIVQGQHTVHLPLVAGFMHEWARSFDWLSVNSGCCDALGIAVPDALVSEIMRFGNVERFDLMLGDLKSPCSASLGNNDHDLHFGLILNCPVWIELASYDEHAASFEKQLGMVVHHEMAHFQHQQNSVTSELHAHARGVAWLFSYNGLFPKTRDEAVRLLEGQHTDVWQNPEIRDLLLERGEPPWRLVRLWMHHFDRIAKDRPSMN